MILLLGLNVQKQKLKHAGPYALTADETMDISRKEQLSIIMCTVSYWSATSLREIFRILGRSHN